MRKKSVKPNFSISSAQHSMNFGTTDRHINVEDDFSDYDSSASNNDVDVKEALRSSISLKTKLNFQGNRPTGFEFHRQEDELSISSDSMDLGMSSIAPKKEKKHKKPEDQETAAMRRERNRLAAQRCRQRRRDRIDKLEKICEKLENDGQKLETEITDLQSEMSHLQKILTNHKCMAVPSSRVIKNERNSSYLYDKYDSRITSN